jgi:hypothetical protein
MHTYYPRLTRSSVPRFLGAIRTDELEMGRLKTHRPSAFVGACYRDTAGGGRRGVLTIEMERSTRASVLRLLVIHGKFSYVDVRYGGVCFVVFESSAEK